MPDTQNSEDVRTGEDCGVGDSRFLRGHGDSNLAGLFLMPTKAARSATEESIGMERLPQVIAALLNPTWTAGPVFAVQNGRNAEG